MHCANFSTSRSKPAASGRILPIRSAGHELWKRPGSFPRSHSSGWSWMSSTMVIETARPTTARTWRGPWPTPACGGRKPNSCAAATSVSYHQTKDPQKVAKWLGHRDGGKLVLKLYSHVLQDHEEEAKQQIRFNLDGEEETPENVIHLKGQQYTKEQLEAILDSLNPA